jgi:plasmid stabilization system protein ParE
VKYAVRVLRRAQRDLHEIRDYLATEAPLQAVSTVDALIAAIESLERFPRRGPHPRDPALRKRELRCLVHLPYLIFYKVLPRQVRVYRVLCGKREYRRLL